MKIWLDDIRQAPEGWILCKNIREALRHLVHQIQGYEVTEISFDHDLGEPWTGYDLAKSIEQAAYQGYVPRMKWYVHSANPVGKENIERAMSNADKYWTQHEAKNTRISED